MRCETVQEERWWRMISLRLTGSESVSLGKKDHLRVFGRDSVKLLEEAGFVDPVIVVDATPAEFMAMVDQANYDSNKLFVWKRDKPGLRRAVVILGSGFINCW